MKISVVIPAYNEEKYIPKTLESIARLKRKPDEVLVVDGNSQDDTVKVAERYGARVIVVSHRGIGYARQRGIEEAKGDVVAFTDADTTVPPNWLTKIEETLTKPGVSGVFGTFKVPDGWMPYRVFMNSIQTCVNSVLYSVGIPMAPGQNIAFWKEKAIAGGGIPEEFTIAEDIELARRLMTVGRVVFLKDLVVISSGRRGNEGYGLFLRIIRSFFTYFIFRRSVRERFPDIR